MQNYTAMLQVRVPVSVRNALNDKAVQAGVPLSTYVRVVLQNIVRGTTPNDGFSALVVPPANATQKPAEPSSAETEFDRLDREMAEWSNT